MARVTDLGRGDRTKGPPPIGGPGASWRKVFLEKRGRRNALYDIFSIRTVARFVWRRRRSEPYTKNTAAMIDKNDRNINPSVKGNDTSILGL